MNKRYRFNSTATEKTNKTNSKDSAKTNSEERKKEEEKGEENTEEEDSDDSKVIEISKEDYNKIKKLVLYLHNYFPYE
jgi:hypothetical protein